MDYKLLNESEVEKHKNIGDIKVKTINGTLLPYKEVGNFISNYDIDILGISIVDFIEDIGLFLGIPVNYKRSDDIDADEYVLNISNTMNDIDVILYYNDLKEISLHFNHVKIPERHNEFYNEHVIINDLEKANVSLMDINMEKIECSQSMNVIFNDDYKLPNFTLKFVNIKNVHIIIFDEGERMILFECS